MPKKHLPPFARALKRLREARGLSQAELALASGLARQRVWEYEQGRRDNPSLDRLVKLADALDCTLDQLAGRT